MNGDLQIQIYCFLGKTEKRDLSEAMLFQKDSIWKMHSTIDYLYLKLGNTRFSKS